jgi:tagatose-1,6-bisphosphate aldolase
VALNLKNDKNEIKKAILAWDHHGYGVTIDNRLRKCARKIQNKLYSILGALTVPSLVLFPNGAMAWIVKVHYSYCVISPEH